MRGFLFGIEFGFCAGFFKSKKGSIRKRINTKTCGEVKIKHKYWLV